MLPTWIIKLLWFFEYCGFNTEFTTILPKQDISRVQKVCILTAHLTVLSVSVFWIYQALVTINAVVGGVGTANDFLKIFTGIVAYILFLTESRLMRCKQQRFWQVFKEIDARFCFRIRFSFDEYLFKTFQWIVGVTFCHTTMAIAFYHAYGFELLVYQWVSFVVIVVPQQLRQAYYFLLVELLSNELHVIERETFQMAKVHKIRYDLQNNLRDSFQRERLKWIRGYYDLLFEMSECLNRVFGWSSVASFLHTFLIFATDLNWLYWRYFNKIFIRSPLGSYTTFSQFTVKNNLTYSFTFRFFINLVEDILWQIESFLIILFTFQSAVKCYKTVSMR